MGTEEPKDRLRRARLAAGFETGTDAARKFHWHVSSYLAHENGQNGIRIKPAQKYARAFNVSASWLLTGEGAASTVSVPVEGLIGAGFVIEPLGESQEIERVDVPAGWGTDLKALKVRGGSMVPAYYDGDLIFYAPQTDLRPPTELIGRECVIRTRDGRMYLKRLLKGSRRGIYVLHSHAAEPILDVAIEWACPVKYVQRA